MRKIEKLPAPDWLINNGPRLLAELKAGLISKVPYSHPEIKKALVKETGGTCAYCENEMDAVSYGEVEHIKPKSLFIDLILDWGNLTWACRKCNGAKGNHWDSDLLDPTQDDPGLHLEFNGPQLTVRDGSLRGERTMILLRLQRAKLFRARAAAIEVLAADILRWQRLQDPYRDAVAGLIHSKLAHGAPFRTSLQTFARSKGFPVDNPPAPEDEEDNT